MTNTYSLHRRTRCIKARVHKDLARSFQQPRYPVPLAMETELTRYLVLSILFPSSALSRLLQLPQICMPVSARYSLTCFEQGGRVVVNSDTVIPDRDTPPNLTNSIISRLKFVGRCCLLALTQKGRRYRFQYHPGRLVGPLAGVQLFREALRKEKNTMGSQSNWSY